MNTQKQTFSKNKKLNTAFQAIFDDLQALGIEEVRHYKKEFSNEKDFNIAQYGNMLVYFDDIRKFYKQAGYKTLDKGSDEKIWELYLRQVGFVARFYF